MRKKTFAAKTKTQFKIYLLIRTKTSPSRFFSYLEDDVFTFVKKNLFLAGIFSFCNKKVLNGDFSFAVKNNCQQNKNITCKIYGTIIQWCFLIFEKYYKSVSFLAVFDSFCEGLNISTLRFFRTNLVKFIVLKTKTINFYKL